jgi:hypothetical protein
LGGRGSRATPGVSGAGSFRWPTVRRARFIPPLRLIWRFVRLPEGQDFAHTAGFTRVSLRTRVTHVSPLAADRLPCSRRSHRAPSRRIFEVRMKVRSNGCTIHIAWHRQNTSTFFEQLFDHRGKPR